MLLASVSAHSGSIWSPVTPPPPWTAGCFCGGGRPARRGAVLAAVWAECTRTASRPPAEENKGKKSSVILKVLKGNKVKMKNRTTMLFFLITVSIINYYFVIIFNYFDCKCSQRRHLQGVRSVGVEGTQVSTCQEWNDDPVRPLQLVKVHIWEERPPEPGIRTRIQNQDLEPGFRTGLVSAAGGGLTLP